MYEINRCYKEFITNREVILAGLSSSGLVLKFLWKNPDEFVVQKISKKPFFQLYFKYDIMFLLIKFDGLKWIDIPCVFTQNSRNLFYSDLKNFPVKIMLINSNTGKLFLNNLYEMPEGITAAFIQGIHTQKDFSGKYILEKINNIRSSFSANEMSRLSLGTL